MGGVVDGGVPQSTARPGGQQLASVLGARVGYEAVKATFELDGDRYVRRLNEVRLFEWSPVWVAMNPAALIAGVKGAPEGGTMEAIDPSQHEALTAATTAVDDLTRWLGREQKPGRVLSATNMTKVDGALSALRDAITALEDLLAAAEPARGHSALRAGVVLRGAQSTCDVLRARARAAGLFDPTHRGYRPGQNPPAGAGHRMSLAISA